LVDSLVTSGIIPGMPDHSVLREGEAELGSGESAHRGADATGLLRVTRLAAYGVIVRDGHVLLCHVSPGNQGEGLWTLPGGGLDFGESPEAAVVREVEEETGLVAAITGPPSIHSDTGVWVRRSGNVRYHHVRFVYPMAVAGGEERLEVDGSTDAFDWVPLEAVAARDLGDLVPRVLEDLALALAGSRAEP
jgi:ADP-ribose pyrophosphatase YjhB (NUDIX family)